MKEMIEVNLDEFYGVNNHNQFKKAEEIITTRLGSWTDLATKFEGKQKA